MDKLSSIKFTVVLTQKYIVDQNSIGNDLPKPMVTYCQLDPEGYLVKFRSNNEQF